MPYRLIKFGGEEDSGPRLEYEARTLLGPDDQCYELNLLKESWKQFEYLTSRCGFSAECLLEIALLDNAACPLNFPLSLEMQNALAHIYRGWFGEFGPAGPRNPERKLSTAGR